MESNELAAGVRTITQVSEFFGELKRSANELAGSLTSEDRGYFTPDEDDLTLGLVVSYYQTRSALFELILAMRAFAERDSRAYDTCFLIAFAAATLLVDIARFLRETVHHWPIVRQKLNEQATQFGIPAGSYDAIQKSLLSARNGWHLYHAIQYYRENAGLLREHAREVNAIPIVDVIDRLQHRLDISITQFTRTKLRTRGSQLARGTASRTVGRALYGVQKLVGVLLSNKYVRPGHVPQLPAAVGAEILDKLLPGDVLVVRKEYALTNYFLPGYWPHAALFLGTGPQIAPLLATAHTGPSWAPRLSRLAQSEPGVVLESMKDGVHLRSLESPFASDSIVVLRSRLGADDIQRGLLRALAHEQKPYDFSFDFRRADRLVCTEVVYRAFDGIGGMRLPLVQRAGRPTLSGGDLLQMALNGDQLEPVAVFAPQFARGILDQQAARAAIRTALSQAD